MDNIEAAYILIVAEADRRLKKDGNDYCGKLVEIGREIDEKILKLMELTKKEERKKKKVKELPIPTTPWHNGI